MKNAIGLILFFLMLSVSVEMAGQFAGAAGTPNTTAIHKDSNIFMAWANKCTIQRGWMNISNKGLGKATVGNNSSALGRPGQNGIVSLGDSGIAIIQFEQPVKNGPGPDFAIFENSFSDQFLELAFVEVSSNGQDWVRFLATCNHSQDTQIGPFDATSQPEKLNNLAGKYRAQFGTPFDLEELKDSSKLNIDSIVFIKIIDAVGSINPQYGLADHKGNWVNDPFPTPFASSGFDLDAVGVMHQNIVGIHKKEQVTDFNIYPNPIQAGERFLIENKNSNTGMVTIYNIAGEQILFEKFLSKSGTLEVQLPPVSKGVYLVSVRFSSQVYTKRVWID